MESGMLTTKSVPLIFKDLIKYLMHCINTKFSFIYSKPRMKKASRCKISTDVTVPLQQQRRPMFKFSRSGPHGGAISALAVNQRHSMVSARSQSTAPAFFECLLKLVLSGVCAVRKYDSTRGKGQD